MMKLLREPLLHFAVAGSLLFAAYSWLGAGHEGVGSAADRTVRITEREVSWIVETTTRQWHRQPTQAELQGMVAEYLREELLAREARELELDRDDTIIRRRLAQKMSFFVEDTARLSEPTDADLRALYDASPERYTSPARSSFEQLYFSRERRGERAEEDARRALAALERSDAGAAPSSLGDPSLLPAELVDAEPAVISGQFGAEFAGAVAAMSPGGWQGPVPSEFGVHLVRLTARAQAEPQPFAEVRAALADEWRRAREEEAKRAYFTGLLRKYDVQVAETVRPLLGSTFAAAEVLAR